MLHVGVCPYVLGYRQGDSFRSLTFNSKSESLVGPENGIGLVAWRYKIRRYVVGKLLLLFGNHQFAFRPKNVINKIKCSLCWFECICETLKYNPRSPDGVIGPWVWRYQMPNNWTAVYGTMRQDFTSLKSYHNHFIVCWDNRHVNISNTTFTFMHVHFHRFDGPTQGFAAEPGSSSFFQLTNHFFNITSGPSLGTRIIWELVFYFLGAPLAFRLISLVLVTNV